MPRGDGRFDEPTGAASLRRSEAARSTLGAGGNERGG
jgi:hypothetical protein